MFTLRKGVKPVDMFRLPDSEDARMMKQESRAIQMILGIKRMPDIYICPQFADFYAPPGGKHVVPHGIYKSTVYLDAVRVREGAVFFLAHEIFHHYQYEMVPNEFKAGIKAKYDLAHELDATAFAVAYTEERCMREKKKRNEWFPLNGIYPDCFPPEYMLNKDDFGVSETVRNRVEILRKKYLEGRLI